MHPIPGQLGIIKMTKIQKKAQSNKFLQNLHLYKVDTMDGANVTNLSAERIIGMNGREK
jgi:hypothetical protein